ncbi:Rso55 protein [Saccharomycopsis crataegensis]|uniref:Rso55 protein n=1 Tax=Saccharomycopsis crataegensis TaxID=43959 RepID=A0AAV5QPP4_9ASCO|nr:Rso55 protein [Saccharomycopsis crataegensis]
MLPIRSISKLIRCFSNTAGVSIKRNKLPPRPKVSEDEIEEVFIKGGKWWAESKYRWKLCQLEELKFKTNSNFFKINKTNSKVQLTHIPTGLVVSSQATRSREQNRKHAREQLAYKLQELLDPENSRAKALRELRIQKKHSKVKKTKKKYKLLDEEKQKQKELEKNEEQEEMIFKFE